MVREGRPELSVVVLSYDTRDVTLRCLRELDAAAAQVDLQTIVVDNASSDGSADAIAAAFPRARLIRNARNRGFAAAVNQAIAVSRAPAILLLNSDCFLGEPRTLTNALDGLRADPVAAALGVRVRREDGSRYDSTRPFPTVRGYIADALLGPRDYPPQPPDGVWRGPVEVDWNNGAFFLLSRAAWEAIGPLDERFFFGWEDLDWCWRARRLGWRILHDPRLTVTHLGGESARRRGDDVVVGPNQMMLWTSLTGREKFWRKNYGALATAALRVAMIAMSSARWLRFRAVGRRDAAAVEAIRVLHALGKRNPRAPGESQSVDRAT